MVCGFDDIRRLRGLNTMTRGEPVFEKRLFAERRCCKAIDQVYGHSPAHPLPAALAACRIQRHGFFYSTLADHQVVKLFVSSLDKALFNELVELMYSPQAIVRNNA
ncbi:uncharacterized protein MONOS_10172 [Monocercomonoides exilis]|uniref:uncharacterized protein n=1 Tax=Monocercomonoides exilis TaxID=2049356 RepID=UPI00355A79DA|nr:hypothetical protein MONOS_10172 [Monocercomonoides exilis]|eukprot:MONOS_10172.1-p1 / transcript=MONOS_10172.1 / gene=MONOS_10172 / organism=Monocercomonoides_exilis_PA203 / gene_product=unspecified product / transcript_product=unspecified product / location=Mono_scaffold00451:13607-14350(-) / protein_length=106 / sequence_SO=supercontig / SO=protein_coding / is_pseudo=false